MSAHRVLAISTAVNALAWGARGSFALFYVAILAEFAWGRGATALGYSLSWLCFVVFAPVAGWLHDRWGARAIVALGGLLLGGALALTGRVTSLTEYYLCFGVLGAAGTACILIPSTTIVSRSFVRSRGTAMGVLSAATPGGAVAFYPMNAWLIATLGWRSALVAFACIVAGITVSLALLYRTPPTGKRHPADGAAARSAAAGGDAAGRIWTLRRALRSIRLWAAFVMTGLGVVGYQIMATHQVAHAVDRGFRQAEVVGLFTFGAGCMMAGNLLGGWLSDRFGRGWVFAAGSIVAMVGIGCLALLDGPADWPLLLIYTASGFGFGMRIAQLSAIPADAFSGPHLGAILGVVQAGGGLGGAIGPFLGGWLFDFTGNYRLAFTAAAVAVAGSAVAAWVAAPPQPRIDRIEPAGALRGDFQVGIAIVHRDQNCRWHRAEDRLVSVSVAHAAVARSAAADFGRRPRTSGVERLHSSELQVLVALAEGSWKEKSQRCADSAEEDE